MSSSSSSSRSGGGGLSSSAKAAQVDEWSRQLIAEGKKVDLEFDTEYMTRDRAWPLNYAAARRLLRDKRPKTARLELAYPTDGGANLNVPGAMRPIRVNGIQVYPHPCDKIVRVPEPIARAPVIILEEIKTCAGAIMRIGDVPG